MLKGNNWIADLKVNLLPDPKLYMTNNVLFVLLAMTALEALSKKEGGRKMRGFSPSLLISLYSLPWTMLPSTKIRIFICLTIFWERLKNPR
jgi:hypothetical protein